MRCRAWALLAVLGCCRSAGRAADAAPPDAGREVMVLGAVETELAAWPAASGPAPPEREVAERVKRDLIASGLFGREAPPGTRAVPARVKVLYGADISQGEGRAGVTLALEWSDGFEERDLLEQAACEDGPPASSLLDCALGHATTGLIRKETIRRGDQAAVLAALDDPDPGLRQVAFLAVAEHRMTGTVPRLLELLRSPDELVRDGAIGALVALREPRAIKPLTEMAEFKDLNLMRRVVDAVGSIGGDEARAYLELVASGHDVPEIRALAEQALERVTRRMDDGGA